MSDLNRMNLKNTRKPEPSTLPNSEDCLDYVPADGTNEDGSTKVKTERDGVKPTKDEGCNEPKP